ncbi:hypothetical protein Tsubulata_938146 [Turnera subulata]|uniref:GDSL esterase/lipase n=1 Tax=Turnera subulata TaxID=218843 RepID=A0A9Q0JDH5_9ROSI|nr:hypothetical protein Tsubulata_938146 [Turnera subulata]
MAALSLLQALVAIFITKCDATWATAALPKFSHILVFGDSSVDSGNSNYIKSVIKSNHYPYGLNFPYHIPTGRFSDGKLIPDFIASLLNIKDAGPPFLDPSLSDYDIRTGVSFASSASGYDDLTNAALGVIPASKQLEMFKNYIARLKGIVGEEEANRRIGGSLIMISSGNNDFLDYYNALTRRRLQFNDTGFQDFVLDLLQNFVLGPVCITLLLVLMMFCLPLEMRISQELYNLGGRSFAIFGVFPNGCLPIQMTARLVHTCLEDLNAICQSYNEKLVALLHDLKESLPGSRIASANIYDPLIDMVHHPQKYGFVETRRGCCGTGLIEVALLCNIAKPLCNKYFSVLVLGFNPSNRSSLSFLLTY